MNRQASSTNAFDTNRRQSAFFCKNRNFMLFIKRNLESYYFKFVLNSANSAG
jgi:hypothetical protein